MTYNVFGGTLNLAQLQLCQQKSGTNYLGFTYIFVAGRMNFAKLSVTLNVK